MTDATRADTTAGQSATPRRTDPRTLQEPQPVATLRAAGWDIPAAVAAESLVRVYDTRLEPAWLRRNLKDMSPMSPGRTVYVGGDYLTEPRPLVDDAAALSPQQLDRWGPSSGEACHIIVLPRPHQAQWLARGRQQLPVEAEGTVISVLCIVDRAHCPAQWDGAALRRALPGATVLLDDPDVAVHVTAIGERPPLRRVPAGCRSLPPATWEDAYLAVNRVLLVVSIAKRMGPTSQPFGRWLGEPPPAPKPSALELLRVEYLLPPATRSQQAERTLRAALRDLAKLLAVAAPAGPQLRQVQVQHGGVVALLEVPREEARRWLWGSGRSGLFLRPFWTADTGRDLDRSNFSLWWLRGQATQADTVWQALHQSAGFYGLLAGGADIAVRVSAEANLSAMQSKVQFKLDNAKLSFAVANPEARWWRLGPLTAAEVASLDHLVRGLGLQLNRESVRYKSANHTRTRTFAFFRATGQPGRLTLDDGGWQSSEARLHPADPPPRRSPAPFGPSASTSSPTAAVSPANRLRQGPALSPQSVWAGPQRPPPAVAERPQKSASTPKSARAPSPTRRTATTRAHGRGPSDDSSDGGAATPSGRQDRQRRRGARRKVVTSDELEDLRELLRSLQAELRALRRENELLRRAQVTDPWRFSGPYYPPVAPATSSAPALTPPPPDPTRTPPRPPDTTAPSSAPADSAAVAAMTVDRTLGPHQREPGGTPDGKRPPRVNRALEVDDHDDV